MAWFFVHYILTSFNEIYTLKDLKTYRNILSNFLFGPEEFVPLENKMLIVATVIGFVVSTFGGLLNFMLGYSYLVLVIPLILAIILAFFFYSLRFGKKSIKLVFPIFLVAFLGLGLIWIFNGGYNSANTYVLITVFVFSIATSPNKRFSYLFIFFISLLLFLHFFHFYFPDRIVDFPDEKTRFIDITITTAYSVAFIYLMITFLIKNYRHERQISEERGKKLEELNTELQQLNASKDKLFSIIAHDLKSPFSSILGFSELSLEQLQMGDLKRTEQSIQMGVSSVKRTLILVENLLTWAKSQSGQIDFRPKAQNILPIIEEVRKSLESSAKLKNISLDVFQSKEIMALVDKNMIQTILRNLVSNALKSTQEKGKVSVFATSVNGHVEITVQDNGVGMSEEILKSLFTFQTNKSTAGTAMEQGSGLGLILCKEFIEYHGGTIHAESVVGKGSRFIFTIPKK